MKIKMGLMVFAAGSLAAALLFAPRAPAVAQERSAASADLSAQQKQQDNKKKAAPAAHRAQPRVAPQRKTPRTVARPKTTPRVAKQPARPRVGTAPTKRVVIKTRFRGIPARGAGRVVIRGHRYSVWRSGYRIRRGGGWRTFVALGTLGAIAIGASQYYPYAYISAPQPYCDGLTEDGCELRWRQVQTVEGDVISQCVAYCPWQ